MRSVRRTSIVANNVRLVPVSFRLNLLVNNGKLFSPYSFDDTLNSTKQRNDKIAKVILLLLRDLSIF